MKYFRNTLNGGVFAYEEDGSQDHLIAKELVPMSAAEVESHVNPIYQPTSGDVDVERDRRIAAGVEFKGILFQSRPSDIESIIGAAQLAVMAMASGAKSNTLRWLDADEDFTWIAADNSFVPMDAITVVEFCKAVVARKQRFVYAGRELKNMDAIPCDYTDDKWWP
ncbi:DUF4376 domain-containing protein [Metapseudomonas otitidis]|uniref:DUF4376 domain-containing protein n=1 Tax=Metapseudomonas otitidis TaxID=319939 RepID=UPI001F2767A1|nr:DUF4376 domain-containing protein [Pseudomonas otitidis]